MEGERVVLLNGENNISLIFDRRESHRGNHHDHEVECLDLVSLNAQAKSRAMDYTPS